MKGYNWKMLTLVWILLTKFTCLESKNPFAKFCDSMDLSTFCIIGNHFRNVNYDEYRKEMKYTQFKHLEKIVSNFFPPIYGVTTDGYVEPWPWIQDSEDDIDYSIKELKLLVEDQDVKGVKPAPPSSPFGTPSMPQPVGANVQGFRFNLYSVNDLCSLDKLYSPIYKLHLNDGPPKQIIRPAQVSGPPGSSAPWPDYRLHYSCAASTPGATCPTDPNNWKAEEAYEQFMENPFDVKITEIKANGRRLHNHLHFEIGFKGGVVARFARGPKVTNFPPLANNPGLRETRADKPISYAFIIVHDENGSPVGDFNARIPCGECQGKCTTAAKCHQGQPKDAIPCMFLGNQAVTHPGQMMIHFPIPVHTIHATWRFSQSASPESFIKEIHIKTLLVLEGAEDYPMVLVRDGRVDYASSNLDRPSRIYSCTNANFQDTFASSTPEHCYRHTPKYGIFGWNAKYPILFPTFKTLGGWDYFSKRFVSENQVDCHAALDKEYFQSQDYPVYGISSLPVSPGIDPISQALPKWRVSRDIGPSLIMGSQSEVYQGLTLENAQFYKGLVNEESLRLIRARELDPQRYLPKERVVPKTLTKATLTALRRLKRLEDMQDTERCRCARFGTVAPPPVDRVPEIGQLEGRRDHSIQMTIAWIALVPFAIFVSRYYKETYAKVFFLQEFWWYTTHVLTFLLAGVFMVGGTYAIEIKRTSPFNVEDTRQVVHALLGGISIVLFTVQFFLGALRLKNPRRRRIQIFLHWFFGLANYFLALGSMLAAAYINSGCMGCPTLILVLLWLVIQITMYIVMEVHMRMTDKELHLEPRRSFLPPPTMRIFNKNAPGARFRILMLVAFGSFSTIFYALMHITIESGGPAFRSCFYYDVKLEALQKQYIELVVDK